MEGHTVVQEVRVCLHVKRIKLHSLFPLVLIGSPQLVHLIFHKDHMLPDDR